MPVNVRARPSTWRACNQPQWSRSRLLVCQSLPILHQRSLLSSLTLCCAQVCHWRGLAGNHAGMSPRQEVRPRVRASQLHWSRPLLRQQLRRLLLHQLLHALCLPGESTPAPKTCPQLTLPPCLSTAQQRGGFKDGKSPRGAFPSGPLSVTTAPRSLQLLPLPAALGDALLPIPVLWAQQRNALPSSPWMRKPN